MLDRHFISPNYSAMRNNPNVLGRPNPYQLSLACC